jgi:metal-responsive CopG/Arc/MetJ family transcriptional regulator
MKEKISISVDEETLDNLDANILKRKFRNRSHAFEYALIKILEEFSNE